MNESDTSSGSFLECPHLGLGLRPGPGAEFSPGLECLWQGPSHLSNHLLPPRVCICASLNWELNWDSDPSPPIWDMGVLCGIQIAQPDICPHHPRFISIFLNTKQYKDDSFSMLMSVHGDHWSSALRVILRLTTDGVWGPMCVCLVIIQHSYDCCYYQGLFLHTQFNL